MTQKQWTEVDDFVVELLTPSDRVLDAALADSDAGGLPPINVAPNQGKFLEILAASHRAKNLRDRYPGRLQHYLVRRALPNDGHLVTLELETHHAEVARKNIERAGFSSLVEVRVGPAVQTLESLVAASAEPFDFVFIDADKEGYPKYLELALALSRSGTLIVADNVVRDGEVIDPSSADERVRGCARSSPSRRVTIVSKAPWCRPLVARGTTASVFFS